MKYAARAPQLVITDAIMDMPRLNVWAPMGMGKSGATLDAIDRLSVVEEGPTLVIGPKLVAEVTWPDEVRKWDHLSGWRTSVVVGDAATRLKALKADANLFTVNFEVVPWLVDQFKVGKRGWRWPFKRVIFDEATRLQGFRLRQGSAQAGALGKVAHAHVDTWVNLTGSPAPNGVGGLWGQQWFIDGGAALGRTHQAFQERWFTLGYETHYFQDGGSTRHKAVKPLEWAQEEIEERMRPTTISLRARDYYPDLKEPIINVIKVRLPTKARIHYQEMERKFFTEIRGHEIEAVHAASKSIKLLQIASGAVYDAEREWHEVHDAKVLAAQSVIQEANGAPVLLVYHFKPTLARLQKAFKRGVLIKTAETIRAWNAGQIRVGFVHPQSIGHGISLQDGGNVICHVDQWWDLERHDQINERLGAMRQMQSGYDRDVFQHYIVAEGTLDEEVLQRHKTKRSVQDLLMEAMKGRR